MKSAEYHKGYTDGYWDGVRDVLSGKVTDKVDEAIASLPITAMSITTRACNCLFASGCHTISDVIGLSETQIQTMRHLGKKSASDIALWLDHQGFSYTVWKRFLP